MVNTFPRELVVEEIRSVLDALRHSNEPIDVSPSALLARVGERLAYFRAASPTRVINATGVVLHTNLGRAVLAREAIRSMTSIADAACDLEFDLENGSRGSRDAVVEQHMLALTGAEAATVVNNNAAAVLLALNTLAKDKEVVVSRGELVEIGGSFRIPDICTSSGARLREVGTTNRTHLHDYADAIGPDTGVLLKVHPSNYSISGFTTEVSLRELAELGTRSGVPVVEDLGSGALIDLAAHGLPAEPVVEERVRSGADAVTFSGDKVLGGPQAGLIVGKQSAIGRMKTNPFKRALRCDKLILAALEATLRLYRASTDLYADLPTLRYLARPANEIGVVAEAAAEAIAETLGDGYTVVVEECASQIGSGAQPAATIPSRAVVISHKQLRAHEIAATFRSSATPIIGRVSDERFWLDCRCIDDPNYLIPSTVAE